MAECAAIIVLRGIGRSQRPDFAACPSHQTGGGVMCAKKFQSRLMIVIVIAFVGFGAQAARAEPEPGVGKVTTVYHFDPSQGQFLEGLAIDKHGNIYVGLALLGQIWKFAPDGTLTAPFATLDIGQFGGIIVGLAVDHDGSLYVCNASSVAGTHGIWRVARDGHAALFAALDPLSHPEATPLTPFPPFGSPPLEYGFPNGMAFDEAGNLYVGDSPLGLIWKITKKGEAEVWLQDQLLNVKTPDGFGANDIEFDSDSMFVSNLEQGSVVRI